MSTKQTQSQQDIPEWQRPLPRPAMTPKDQQEEAEWLAACSTVWHDPLVQAYAEAQAEQETRQAEQPLSNDESNEEAE